MNTRRIQFGDKHIRDIYVCARSSDVITTEINRVCEVAGDIDVASSVERQAFAFVGPVATEGGGPLMGARRVE